VIEQVKAALAAYKASIGMTVPEFKAAVNVLSANAPTWLAAMVAEVEALRSALRGLVDEVDSCEGVLNPHTDGHCNMIDPDCEAMETARSLITAAGEKGGA
jgi:hypothetical protein